jgi:hypothetical protein
LFPLAAYCVKTFYYTYIEYQKAVKKEPQIILTEYGLQTAKTKLNAWDRVQASVITEPVDKDNNSLVYRYEGGKEVLPIGTAYDISITELNRLLKIYQGRFFRKNPEIEPIQFPTFDDDKTVPFETKILYPKGDRIQGMIFTILLSVLSFGMYIPSFYDNPQNLLLLFPIGFGFFFLFLTYQFYKDYKKAVKKVPQIIINEEGMQTINTNFFIWDSIHRERISLVKEGKATYYCLEYEYERSRETFHLNNSSTSPEKLHHLLKIYRGRFEQQRNKENLQRS